MLIEKINTCTSSINELSTLRSNALSLNAFETSVNKLSVVDSLVTNFVSTVKEMNKHAFCKTNLSAEDIEKMQDAIKTCAKAVNDMNLSNNDVTAITTVFQSQKAMLNMFWKSTAKTHIEPICSYLGIIQTFAVNKAEIANLSKSLMSGATTEPTSDVVKALVKNAEKANEITSNFQISDGVRDFLEKAKNGNATYADITEDVAKWIKEQNLVRRIKITF